MKNMIVTLFTILILSVRTCAYADLKTLMEVGKNQAELAKALNEETKNYNTVKDAIIQERLKEGVQADKIRKKYGEPIIDVFDEKKNVYKWLYMPATSSHFEGEKLYLFVDEKGRLVGWKLIGQ